MLRIVILFVTCSKIAADTANMTEYPALGLANWWPESQESTRALLSNTVVVFGVPIFATKYTNIEKVQHAANILAEYLDNDGDGCPDKKVVDALLESKAAMIYTLNGGREMEVFQAINADPALRPYLPELNEQAAKDLIGVHGSGVNPLWHSGHGKVGHSEQFDEAVEEILHMVTDAGWEVADPQTFNTAQGSGSQLTKCLDLAKGDWFTYDDDSCDYACHATEYLFWLVTTVTTGGRCNNGEWALCTADDVKSRDPCGYALVTGVHGDIQPITRPANGHYRGPPTCEAKPTLTCKEVKVAYRKQKCCNNPKGLFSPPKGRLLKSIAEETGEDTIARIKEALFDAEKIGGRKEAEHLKSQISQRIRPYL